MAALSVAADGGSASAATLHTAQPAATTITGVTWHKLALIHGWQPGQSHFTGTGSPAWAVQNGVVYLSGSIV
jgi:hypothetical protein